MTSVEAGSWRNRWLLDPLGRLVARFADAISRVIARRPPRHAPRDDSTFSRRDTA
jgi:hypothetical protein